MRKTILIASIAALMAPAGAAHAQSTGGVSSLDISAAGVSVGVDPQKGASVGVDAGDNGGLTLEAGPQGANLNLRQGSTPSVPGITPPTNTGRQDPAPSSRSETGGSAPDTSSPTEESGPSSAGPRESSGRERSANGRSASAGGTSSPGGETGGRGERSVKTDPASSTEDKKGVAPVLDLIERIPTVVWAGLAALALIALAMWMLWIRGRRRLERNAWVDTESGAMNVVAFETLLAQEWARSVRYHRPLGLLLLQLEETAPDGGRRPLSGKRLDAARNAITERTRESDIVAQLSPTRFSVICPESPGGSVQTLAIALERSLEVEQVHARVGTGERLESDRGPADIVSRAAAGIDAEAWSLPEPDEQATVQTPLHVAA
jgi:GGDEF domain-containing protein